MNTLTLFKDLTVGQTIYIISFFTDKIAYFIEPVKSISDDNKIGYERLYISTEHFHFNDVHKYMQSWECYKAHIFTNKELFIEYLTNLLIEENFKLSDDNTKTDIVKHNHHLLKEISSL